MGLKKGNVPRSHALVRNTRNPVNEATGIPPAYPNSANGCEEGSRDYPPTLSLGRQACPHLAKMGVNEVAGVPTTSSLGGHTHLPSSHHLPLLLLVVADEAPVGDASRCHRLGNGR